MTVSHFAVAAGLAAFVSLSSAGCGALDELDKANAMMDTNKPPAEAAAAPNEAKRRGLDWSDAKSVTSGELDSSITRCSIDGAVTFTRAADCLSQGGTPGRI